MQSRRRQLDSLGNGTEVPLGRGVVTISHSIVEGGFSGENNLPADPLLGALLNNGGLTETCALDQESPAIDAGLFAGSKVSGNVTVPLTDQRGTRRPKGAGVDIGAYEYYDEDTPAVPGGGGGGSGCRVSSRGAELLLLLFPISCPPHRRRRDATGRLFRVVILSV